MFSGKTKGEAVSGDKTFPQEKRAGKYGQGLEKEREGDTKGTLRVLSSTMEKFSFA